MKEVAVEIPLWVYGCAALWLAFSMWRGWSLGVVRQAVAVVALGVAIGVGYATGPWVGVVIPAIGYPAFLRPLVGGVLLGGLVWLLINIFSAIIFRKTSDQSVGVVRVIFGGLGACLGLVSGCLILALGAWAVRWVGSVQEGMHTSLSPRKKPGSPNAGESSPETLFTTLKSALDHSSTGNLLKSLDPIAPDKYRLLAKMGQIAADPAALERLMAQPNLQPLLHNANVRALRSDTELRDAIQEKDIWKILQNPRIQAAARDSQILHVLRSLNLEKALNEALAGPVSGGVESPKTPGAPEKKRVPPR